jgi:ferredoxin--NADP+ reductase
MNEITEKKILSPQIVQFRVLSPVIAEKHRAGQFVMVRADEKGERIPLTIVDADPEAGTVTIALQIVGKTTHLLSTLEEGDRILTFVGPLGKATHIEKFGTVIVIGGGIGIAEVFPVAKAMKAAGNTVIAIIGARTKDMLVLEEEVASVADEIFVTTDDGSYKRKGLVTEPLEEILGKRNVEEVVAVGPVPMMKAVSEVTRPYGVKTLVSLNSIMIDATGMCGCCRVSVGGEVKFACVDGPEFDGHLVDFDELSKRLIPYREQEKMSYDRYLECAHQRRM